MPVPQAWVLFLVNLLANPVFVYACSFLFSRDDAGSNAIKGIYFAFGIVAPVVMSVLQSLGGGKKDVADVLRWFFFPVPIFSLSSGFQNISNISVFNAAFGGGPKSSFSKDVALYNLLFLLISIPFYWTIIACFEMKVFDNICFCRCIKNIGKNRNTLFGAYGSFAEV